MIYNDGEWVPANIILNLPHLKKNYTTGILIWNVKQASYSGGVLRSLNAVNDTKTFWCEAATNV